jgi:hypothetical protein
MEQGRGPTRDLREITDGGLCLAPPQPAAAAVRGTGALAGVPSNKFTENSKRLWAIPTVPAARTRRHAHVVCMPGLTNIPRFQAEPATALIAHRNPPLSALEINRGRATKARKLSSICPPPKRHIQQGSSWLPSQAAVLSRDAPETYQSRQLPHLYPDVDLVSLRDTQDAECGSRFRRREEGGSGRNIRFGANKREKTALLVSFSGVPWARERHESQQSPSGR